MFESVPGDVNCEYCPLMSILNKVDLVTLISMLLRRLYRLRPIFESYSSSLLFLNIPCSLKYAPETKYFARSEPPLTFKV